MKLTSKQRRFLRGEAHHLKPVVQVGGRGLVQEVVDKVEMELACHELIKVRVADDDRRISSMAPRSRRSRWRLDEDPARPRPGAHHSVLTERPAPAAR